MVELGGQPLVATAANLLKMLCYGNRDNLMAGIICVHTHNTYTRTYTHTDSLTSHSLIH